MLVMIDSKTVFEKSLVRILEHLDDFESCSHIANDLSNAALMHENPDAVIVAETLNHIFFQLDMIVSDFNIGDDEIKTLKNDLSTNIRLLSDSFKNNNFEKIYINLRDAHYVWSKFQSRVFQTLKEKNRKGESD